MAVQRICAMGRMEPMNRIACWLALGMLLTAAGCPRKDPAADAARFKPSAPLPASGALLSYDKLRLGMNAVELSQVYNAPEGRGEGFARVIAPYDAVAQHFITFDQQPGQPARRMICAFYRDQLYLLVDRREGLSAAQAQAWYDECRAAYGNPARETVAGAQWRWEMEGGVTLTFTQDNASPEYLLANVVLVHEPTRAAAHEYLAMWEKEHPQAEKPAAE